MAQGFEVRVAMGRERGIDLDARHPDGRRWVIEARQKWAPISSRATAPSAVSANSSNVLKIRTPPTHSPCPTTGATKGCRLPQLAEKDRIGLVVLWVRLTPTGTPTSPTRRSAHAVEHRVARHNPRGAPSTHRG